MKYWEILIHFFIHRRKKLGLFGNTCDKPYLSVLPMKKQVRAGGNT